MSPTVEPLLDPQRLFAQPYSDRFADGGSVDSCFRAIELGADGLFAAARLDSSGEVVLGGAKRRFRREAAVVPLDALYADGRNVVMDIALVVDSVGTATSVLDGARRHAEIDRLWLCSSDVELLENLRGETPATRLVHACDPAGEPRGAEQHAARLRRAGIDAVLVPEERATAGLVALMHRFGRLVLAQGADYERTATRALSNGVDGLTGIDTEVLRTARDGDAKPGH